MRNRPLNRLDYSIRSLLSPETVTTVETFKGNMERRTVRNIRAIKSMFR